MRMKERH